MADDEELGGLLATLLAGAVVTIAPLLGDFFPLLGRLEPSFFALLLLLLVLHDLVLPLGNT